jgi:hypothetical protein
MLSFDLVRSTTYQVNGMLRSCGFDAEMTPEECYSPFEAFVDAHATLAGPTSDENFVLVIIHNRERVLEIEAMGPGSDRLT